MPSFRAQLEIGDVYPGHAPEEVMAMADAALSATHSVESRQIEVVARVPRIVLRFTVPDSAPEQEGQEAVAAATRLREAVQEVATTGRLTVLRRERGRWLPVS